MDNKGFYSSSADITSKFDSSSEDYAINADGIDKPFTKRANVRVHITADDLLAPQQQETKETNVLKTFAKRFHPKSLIPIIEWLPKYKATNLKDDFLAAITVAVMHVPQGLAYGQLAGAAAIQGLYVSTFPPLVYAMLGTGKHVSIGTFAVVSLLIRGAVSEVKEQTIMFNGNETMIGDVYSFNEIVTTLSTAVGILQILMGVLSLGTLAVLLSEPMLSGFTTGAAIHVIASQLKGLFDIKTARRTGIFKVILTIYDVCAHISEANIVTTVMSLSAMVFIYQGQFLNDKFKAKLIMPVPVELIAVVIVTLISYFTGMHEHSGTEIMGEVPTGMPPLTIPQMNIFPSMIQPAFIIAFISFVICLSLGKTFARRNNYSVSANQELMAMGSANVVGSFLDCFPCAASLSRSSLQEKVGSKTQLTTVMCSAILILVIMFVGPLFFYLPKCVLSSIIIVALKGMILQVNDCFRYAKVSFVEAVVWSSTFLACLIFDLEYGIAVGALCTVGALLYRDSQPRIRYVKPARYSNSFSETTGWNGGRQVSVIRVESEINFLNRDALKENLLSQIQPLESDDFTALVVLDLSGCSFIDCSGCTTIRELLTIISNRGYHICVVGADEGVTESVMLSGNSKITFSANLRDITFDMSTESHRF